MRTCTKRTIEPSIVHTAVVRRTAAAYIMQGRAVWRTAVQKRTAVWKTAVQKRTACKAR